MWQANANPERSFLIIGLWNISRKSTACALENSAISGLTGMVKKVIQQGHSPFDARSGLPVREHGKRATCLRVAAPGLRSQSHFGGVGSAKAGNAAGGFFQHSHDTLTALGD